MLTSLQMIYTRLLDNVSTENYRFLYHEFTTKNRLTGLVGPRGVGKTTLLLQYIKNHHLNDASAFYFSADHLYFKTSTLYEFVETLFLKQSINTFFIDEIHKYVNWNQELKNLYDGFPQINIVFSGSSSLDLVKGSYDLSRRAKMYYLPGLSFREYLNFACDGDFALYSFDDLMENPISISQKLSKTPGLLGHFEDYLKQGFYPFFKEDPLSYYEKILSIIEKTIYEDVANFYNLKTGNLRHLSKILNFLATIPPGKISTYNVGKNLGIDDKTASNYLTMLHETGLIEIIYPAEQGNQGLRKPEKVFFNNTNLYYAVANGSTNPIVTGAVRELAFIQATKNAGLAVFHSKQGDYRIKQFVYEIGGNNKTRKQIKNIDQAFIVKDNALSAAKGSIPLVYFGFLY
jgi:uncharacterized protein